jgi:hypothetical protein
VLIIGARMSRAPHPSPFHGGTDSVARHEEKTY